MAGEWPEARFEQLLTEPVRNGIYKKKGFHGRGAKIVNMGELVFSTEFVDYTNSGSTGTKMPRTNWADMARYDLVVPPEPVAEAFTEQMRSSVERITAGIHESRTLAALRDTLLPKLTSGELRIEDNERIIEVTA